MDNSIINAVKRLERIGDNRSKTTQKLLESAELIANKVAATILVEDVDAVELPRGYGVQWTLRGNYLLWPETVYYAFEITRERALPLAADSAPGWLDEVADYIASQGGADIMAADLLASHQ